MVGSRSNRSRSRNFSQSLSPESIPISSSAARQQGGGNQSATRHSGASSSRVFGRRRGGNTSNVNTTKESPSFSLPNMMGIRMNDGDGGGVGLDESIASSSRFSLPSTTAG